MRNKYIPRRSRMERAANVRSRMSPLLDEGIRKQATGIGKIIAGALPPGWGFTLLVFPFGDGTRGHMNYISSADRETMLIALKELVGHMEKDAGK